MENSKLIVFTDLDGSLLGHHDYDYTPALPVLDRLIRNNVPLVLASSKTAMEMIPLRAALGFSVVPLICENGAGVVTDDDPNDVMVHDRIRAALATLPVDLRDLFKGFSDIGAEGISRVTGLDRPAAHRAAARQFSEPGLWCGTADRRRTFVAALAEMGITATVGGRFLTLGFGRTKASRMPEIAALYGSPTTIALGDAPNDITMIEAADHGIILPNPDGVPIPVLAAEASGQIQRATHPGPVGWAQTLSRLLTSLGCPN
jgi:mannosyl-3-phosphoglycerate phosphatase